jgi:hypothetical protein
VIGTRTRTEQKRRERLRRARGLNQRDCQPAEPDADYNYPRVGCRWQFTALLRLAGKSSARAICYRLVFCSAYRTRNVHTEYQYPGMARGLDGQYPLRVAVCRKGSPSR